MNDRDDWAHDRLARLEPPPRRPGFEQELWDRIQAREHALARRWRLTSVALGAVAIAAISAAAVLAATRGGGSTIDRTVSCATQPQGGVPVFEILASPTPPGFDYASLAVGTGDGSFLLGVDTRYKGFQLDGSNCRAVNKSRVPLDRSRLPSGGVDDVRCLLGGRVLLRLRLRLNAVGKPTSALLAVRMQKKNRPVAFVEWSPKDATGYVSRACGG